MPFLIVRNDITKIHADAIVNTANEDLREGTGTSRAIYVAAGEEKLKAACRELGHCQPGRAVITDGFGLPAKYIIHTVGPLWNGGGYGEAQQLYDAYFYAMKLAAEYKLESIAFPLISSGNYGYPKEKALKQAVSAISDFLLEHDMMVYLVLYDNKSLAVSKKLFQSIEEFIDDRYVEENRGLEVPEFLNQRRRPEFDNRHEYSILDHAMRYDGSAAQKTASAPASVTAVSPEPMTEASSVPFLENSIDILASDLSDESIDDMLSIKDETFTQMLFRFIDQRNLKDSTVYNRANIDRRLFSKIRNDIYYTPSKKTVLSFAVALELSLDETKDLLMKAGLALSDCNKGDLIVEYFINHKNYDIFEINEMLFYYEQPILG